MHEHEHHHENDEHCSCGHEHHHHEEDEHCGCGHEHHHHEEDEHCGCGHEHHHEGHEHHGSQVFLLEGLDCPNCAAKIEAKIRTLPEITFASVIYATKQLRVNANNTDSLIEKLQAAVDSVEDGVTVTPRSHSKDTATKIYMLEGLDCANCAAKIEAKIGSLPDVEDCSITFSTLQMKLCAKDPDALIPTIQQTINAMEDGITIVPKEAPVKSKPSAEHGLSEEKKSLISILSGAVLFVIGEILEHCGASVPVLLAVLIPAYLILGAKVLMTAARNIRKGQVFDENFLMSVATLGAFGIQNFPEAVGVMLFYRIGEYFEDRAVEQSRSQIMSAVDLRPETVNLINGDNISVIGAEAARVGDLLLVRPGERIPLDAVIVEGESRIDTSPVTGEPVPVKTGIGDSVLSGCVNTSGLLKIRVQKPLEESMVTKILDSVENAAANKPEIDKFITRFSRYYTPAVVFGALFVALVLPFLLPDWHFFVDEVKYAGMNSALYGAQGTASIFTALTFLVISCPCALVLSVPLAFFSGIGAASKKGILFKGGNAIEALANVKAIVMDKTGTITKGNFQVQEILPSDASVSEEALLQLAARCEISSTHPIAVSIVNAAQERGITVTRPETVEEIAGHGIRAGAVLCGNRKLMEKYRIDLSGYSSAAYGTEVLIAKDGKYLGCITISDTLKEDAVEAIAAIRKHGIVTAMLTGDAQASADYVAKQTGIDEVHAKLLPGEKLDTLKEIRKAHGSVMFVGDGINDAPVLAGADIGAAMGSGADAAIEAADVVFMNSEMSAIPSALAIAASTRKISWQNVYFALGIKFLVMILGLCGFANLWIAVFADTGVSMLCLLNSIRILKQK